MRLRIVSPILGLAIGFALPAVACELHQAGHASDRTVTALLAEPGAATQTAGNRHLTACEPGDAACAAGASAFCKAEAGDCTTK